MKAKIDGPDTVAHISPDVRISRRRTALIAAGSRHYRHAWIGLRRARFSGCAREGEVSTMCSET